MYIGVTLTSSLEVGEEYIGLTKVVARAIAKRNMGIVYGGTNYGMMSTLAESYKQSGGATLTGVMAKDLMAVTKGYAAFEGLDQTFTEDTMEDRKHRIIELSDAFIILPGGYGTLEEIGSIVGGRVNKLFDKPIAILNHDGFYDTLLAFLDEMHDKAFSKIAKEEIVFVSEDVEAILDYFENYSESELTDKFIKESKGGDLA